MKVLHKYLLIPAMTVLVLSQTSCKKDFLEIQPKGYTIAKTTSDYEQLLNATYLSTSFSASSYLADDIAAQEMYLDGALLRAQRLFMFSDSVYLPDELPTEITDQESYVPRLYVYNKVINEVMGSQNGTEEQKLALQAEAKVGRAVCLLSFLNDFSKPYNAATAETDLGVPIITKAEVTQTQFVRATIKEGYDFMIKDLTDALPYLGEVVNRRKFSKAAAEFYLGRIYLYMADFARARTHIDGAFAALAGSAIPLDLYDYNVVLDPNSADTWYPDAIFLLANKPLAANDKQIIYNITSRTFFFNSANTFVTSPQTAALYDPSDKRLNLYSNTELFGDFQFPHGMRRYSAGFTQDIGPSLPDLYLMRAELKARTNDLGGAKADVEFLRVNRMPANIAVVPANIATDQTALVKFILDERIREFATSGLRWLDQRRLSVDPLYSNTVRYTHEVYDADGNVVATYTLRPERFALKFGQRMLNENKGLVENP